MCCTDHKTVWYAEGSVATRQGGQLIETFLVDLGMWEDGNGGYHHCNVVSAA